MGEIMHTKDFGDDAEVKVISCEDGKTTQHTVMVTKVDGRQSQQLDKAGCRSEETFFTVIDGGLCASHYDPYKFGETTLGEGIRGHTLDVIKAIHFGTIGFEELEHDEVIMPDDERLTDNGTR